jgi:hypothetical protein
MEESSLIFESTLSNTSNSSNCVQIFFEYYLDDVDILSTWNLPIGPLVSLKLHMVGNDVLHVDFLIYLYFLGDVTCPIVVHKFNFSL